MATEAIHTVPTDDGWANKREGSNGSLSRHTTKAGAVRAGRERARQDQTDHIVHNEDGSIGARYSYGHDPKSRKG